MQVAGAELVVSEYPSVEERQTLVDAKPCIKQRPRVPWDGRVIGSTFAQCVKSEEAIFNDEIHSTKAKGVAKEMWGEKEASVPLIMMRVDGEGKLRAGAQVG